MKYRYIFFIIFFIFNGCISDSDIKDADVKIKKVIDAINGEPVVPRNANSIYINPLINKTGNIILSEKLFLRMKDLISMDGRLYVVPDNAKSDLMLEIIISSYSVQNIKYGDMGKPIIKRTRITAAVRLTDNKRKKIVFDDKEIQSFKTFSDINPPIETESQVMELVLDDLAKRILLKTITGWYTKQMTIIERGKL